MTEDHFHYISECVILLSFLKRVLIRLLAKSLFLYLYKIYTKDWTFVEQMSQKGHTNDDLLQL